MNVHFTILLTVEIISVFTEIHALPGWWWGSRSKHKYWNRDGSGRVDICSSGECVQAWKCPKSAVSYHSSNHCNHWNNGAMVCCVLNNREGDNFSETFIFNEHSKSTEIPNIQNNFQSDINQGNGISTKSVDVHWKRKSWDPPISFSSYGDVFKESREKIPSTPRFNSNNVSDRTTVSEIKPRTSDFRVVFPTESVWLPRTTRHPTYTTRKFKATSDSKVTNDRTTISGIKRRTSDFRVVFPTESVWLPRTTRHPTYTTRKFKPTSDSKVTKSWMSSTVPTAATSSYFTKNTRKTTPGYVSTTRKLDRTSSSGYTKSWVTRSTTTVAPTFSTKYPMQPVSKTEFFTKTWNRATDYKSTKLWPTRSTTVSRMGYPSKTTRRAVFRPTDFPAKPSEYDKVTLQVTSSKPDNNRRQEWDKSTPTSTRNQSTKRTSTSNPKTTRSTPSSTRRHRVTTPLPNVNTHLCGIRDERSNGNRGRRSNEKKYDVSDDKIYSSRSPSSWQYYQRIVGGDEVEPFSWPWVAALYKVTSPSGNRFLCAGSLINKNFVLTAAHVFTPDDLRTVSYVVMLGTHNAQDAVAQYLVSSILRHPRYENRYYYYDIALLRLVKPVTFNNYVMPVCLPSPDAPLLRDQDLEGKNVTVMGWGDESFGGISSRVLKEATFPIVSRRLCNASYVRVASNRFPKGITDGMLCAGDPNGGKDACQGDSGGPLTSIERGRYTQVGIVSFGYQCGDKEFPGVYTKVAPFVSWIAENTLNNEDYETGDYDYY